MDWILVNGFSKKNGPDETEMQTYISTVLNLHAKGELRYQSAVDGLMKLCVYLKNGDLEVASRMLHGHKNCCNWPSTTGNQSGNGRVRTRSDCP